MPGFVIEYRNANGKGYIARLKGTTYYGYGPSRYQATRDLLNIVGESYELLGAKDRSNMSGPLKKELDALGEFMTAP